MRQLTTTTGVVFNDVIIQLYKKGGLMIPLFFLILKKSTGLKVVYRNNPVNNINCF